MRRLGPGAQVVAALAAAIVLVGGGLVPHVGAQGPDRSDVVLVLDFSASILDDKTNRNRFGAALERIADRVDEISTDLVAGDTTVTIVQFATRAAGYPGCTDLKLLDRAPTVARFADCLRSVAVAYRKGLTSALTGKIGVDTNYVAAMEAAARHLPADAVRPAMILFTDGKHDVKGVPVSQVHVALERLFGSRSPFALLPVGMGLDPKKRSALTSGLEGLRIIRDMPACISGATFDWPQVVFQTADQAGNAVAVALQDATCTFTAAPTPTPTPVPTPAAVKGIRLTAGDGRIELTWTPAAATAAPIVDYAVRCRAGDGDWIESTEGVSLEPTATIEGLTNGTAYQCEVAAVGPSAAGPWTASAGSVTPFGRPAAPAKPSVEALNHALRIAVTPAGGQDVTSYHYECSSDQGGTWPATVDAAPDDTSGQIGNLTNGVDYTCRAFAKNALGQSEASPLSDAVKPCGSTLECNSLLLPVLGGLGLLLAGGVLVALVALLRGRNLGHVVAVVDVVHTANVGHGSHLGIAFVRAPDTRKVTGIVADRGSHADLRIRRLRGGRFEVRDKVGRHVTADGEAVVVVDSVGVKHGLVLQAFATNAASRVASRR
ncbi:MAG TPA: fibronectin type III domain-containing protein [Candidatus Limnocylindrales bacterium]|nr:fibronectin type III domain-containing protein [Candidatus Limnocylindrales bacterium]